MDVSYIKKRHNELERELVIALSTLERKDKIYKIKTMLLTEVVNKIIPKSFFEKLENMGLFKTDRHKEKKRTRE